MEKRPCFVTLTYSGGRSILALRDKGHKRRYARGHPSGGQSCGHDRARATVALDFAREGAAVVCSDVQKSADEEGYEEDIEVDIAEMVTGSIHVIDGGDTAGRG